MEANVYLLPDTNVLLHFPMISDVDWLTLCEASSATILIAPIVLKELDKHKDGGGSRRLRDRAAKVLRDLYPHFKKTKSRELRNGVVVEFLRDPSLDLKSYRLDRERNDDWLIASAIEAMKEKTPARVAIVTADMALEINASRHVEVIQMPEDLRLREPPDSEKQRANATNSTVPGLRLAFSDEKDFTQFEFVQLEPWSEDRKNFGLKVAREKHPIVHYGIPQGNMAHALNLSSITGIGAHNEKVEQYYRDVSIYHDQLDEFAAWFGSSVAIELILFNNGRAPGEDIDIGLHLPDGVDVIEQGYAPSLPELPVPPPQYDPSHSILSALLAPRLSFADLSLPTFVPNAVPNAQLIGIKRTNSFDVEFYVRHLKHHNREPLPYIYVRFPSQPSSFTAEYRIVAGNVPEPVTGKLNFIYKPR